MAESLKQFKLAAIDLDGTLLGPDHAISEANVPAVRRLQTAGAQVVLASGRHYNSMHKYVESLPGVQWMVSCQGGEVSDAGRTTILSRQFLLSADVAKITDAGHPGFLDGGLRRGGGFYGFDVGFRNGFLHRPGGAASGCAGAK